MNIQNLINHDIKQDIGANRYIYFELITSNTADYVFSSALMQSKYNWNHYAKCN